MYNIKNMFNQNISCSKVLHRNLQCFHRSINKLNVGVFMPHRRLTG